jgi:tetratricopeptide (TPR) repeat protein
MPESAAELEQRAERAVRRGELHAALQLFEELIALTPGEERVRQRMESVRALLQPAELSDGQRPPEPDEPEPRPAAGTLTDAEQGELHASAGRFVEALRCYERALAAAPENELIWERLEELRELAPPGARADLGSAEQLPAPASAPAPPRAPSRSTKVAHASFAPIEAEPAARPLPRDPVKMLEALLERIRAGRRGASTRA